MNGLDFYRLAGTLHKDVATPAALRSATSRAYYAAFHQARDFLLSIGVRMPKGSACHAALYRVLSQSSDPEVKHAGLELNSLREARNKADYDLRDRQQEEPGLVKFHVDAAKDVIDCIDACFPGQAKAGIHADLRTYARDTLRLTVT